MRTLSARRKTWFSLLGPFLTPPGDIQGLNCRARRKLAPIAASAVPLAGRFLRSSFRVSSGAVMARHGLGRLGHRPVVPGALRLQPTAGSGRDQSGLDGVARRFRPPMLGVLSPGASAALRRGPVRAGPDDHASERLGDLSEVCG